MAIDKSLQGHQLIRLHKPYKVLCQFTDNETPPGLTRSTLADFIERPGFFPAGRLDYDSEGLVILTNSGTLQARIADPKNKMEKIYWAQIEGSAPAQKLAALANGVTLNDGLTKPCKIRALSQPPALAMSTSHLPDHRIANSQWLEIALREGRNRQVRRMFAHIGHPVLRLIRSQIGHWQLGNLPPGAIAIESIHLPKVNESRKKSTRKKRDI